MSFDRWALLPLLSLIVPALAIAVAVALWKLLHVGRPRTPTRRAAAVSGYILFLGTVYAIAFLALWSWGSGS